MCPQMSVYEVGAAVFVHGVEGNQMAGRRTKAAGRPRPAGPVYRYRAASRKNRPDREADSTRFPQRFQCAAYDGAGLRSAGSSGNRQFSPPIQMI